MICNVFADPQLPGPGLPAQYSRVPGVSGVQAFALALFTDTVLLGAHL
jgi:hypothetical protein